MSTAKQIESWLREIMGRYGAVSGTVHLSENDGLRMAAAVNIPQAVQDAVAWVPNGKGMAGLALQRGEPVQTCNLQDDRSGSVRPGAKAVNAQGAIALPVKTPEGTVRAVIGIAFSNQREFTGAELAELMGVVTSLPRA